jgi:hypothetical protein
MEHAKCNLYGVEEAKLDKTGLGSNLLIVATRKK